jgi:hypothetical protein
MNRISPEVQKVSHAVINNYPKRSILSGLIAGGGIYYATEKRKYYQIPIAFLFPSIYTGYHLYKNKTVIHENLKIHTNVTIHK